MGNGIRRPLSTLAPGTNTGFSLSGAPGSFRETRDHNWSCNPIVARLCEWEENAVALARQIEHQVEEMKKTLLPGGVAVTVSRDYGETAEEKSNELISHMLIATAAGCAPWCSAASL